MAKNLASQPTQVPTHIKCVICLDIVPHQDSQQLPCEHRFCSSCLGLCAFLSTCPMPSCSAPRTADVLVDEIDDSDDAPPAKPGSGESVNKPNFTLNMLQLEERERCEVRRGNLQCLNSARMTLIDCRHRVCFDCVAKMVTACNVVGGLPRCPIALCANMITRGEAAHVAQKVHSIQRIVQRIESLLPSVSEDNRPVAKDDIRISCSVHGAPDSTKFINVPRVCTVADMITAIMQVLRVDRNRTAASIATFMRSDASNKKLEFVSIKTVGKKTVKDAAIADKAQFVLDLKNEIRH